MVRAARNTDSLADSLRFPKRAAVFGIVAALLTGCAENTAQVVSSLPGISRFQYDGYDLLLERDAGSSLLMFVNGRRVESAQLRQGGLFTLTAGGETTVDYEVLLIQPENATVKSETYEDARLRTGKVYKRSSVLTVPWYGEPPTYEQKPDPFAPTAAEATP